MSASLRLSVAAAALVTVGMPLLGPITTAAAVDVCVNGQVVNAYPPRTCKPPVTVGGGGGGGVTVPPATGGGGLPFTGLNTESLIADAVLLLAGGGAIVVFARRRRVATA